MLLTASSQNPFNRSPDPGDAVNWADNWELATEN